MDMQEAEGWWQTWSPELYPQISLFPCGSGARGNWLEEAAAGDVKGPGVV